MAAQRPVVLVFQEFATLSSSPTTPELNCLVAGPAYWIQDFPEDRDDIKISDADVVDYGVAPLSLASGVAIDTDAVTVADAPNNKIGAILDQASVRVFTSKTYVELAFGADMVTVVDSPVVTSAGANFVTAGVLAGDTLVMTNTAGSTTLTRKVVSVTTNSLTLNSETPTFQLSLVKFRVQRAMPESEISSAYYTFVPATNSITVNALATLNVGVDPKRIVSAELYIAYRSLRQDLADVKTLGSVNEVLGQLGRVDSRNPLAVGVSVALQNTNTTIQYFGISTDDLLGYTAMKDAISGRKDIYAVVPLSSDILVLAMLKAEFNALADTDFAQTNGTPQKFRVAIGSTAALPTTKIIIDKNTDGRVAVNTALSLPETAHTLVVTGATYVTDLVVPGDKFIITSDAAPTSRVGIYFIKEVLSETTVVLTTELPGGVALQTGNANISVYVGSTGTLRGTPLVAAATVTVTSNYTLTFTGVNFITSNVQPGDVLNITADAATITRVGEYVVSQVLSATSLQVDGEIYGGIGAGQSAAANFNIEIGATNIDRVAAVVASTVASIQDPKLYLELYDANGTFVDDGIIPTDLVEMPQNPGQESFTEKHSFQIASISSNQRLLIVNNGRSTSLYANELPHGVSRNSPVTTISTTPILTYRITRTLDKAGQVDAIVAEAQSIAHRRVVDVWPDLCDVGGLVDGSLPRDPLAPTTAQPAASQPGYYLACAVGGMTAGLPSHQGFTNLGIAGISKIYNSNTYFSDKDITDISNGGWFVFQQDTPTSLPYVVHQLTTDVSTLQSGEFSMVKNFDFVSLFFADILDDYLGIWNINPETINFVATSVNNGIDNLKLRRRPRIGAPLIDGTLTSIAVSTISADRLEIYVECQFPAPLNVVALHLVSA